MNATLFLLLFAALLMVYGLILYRTGDASLMPYRSRQSITGKKDVRRVGRIVLCIGGLLAAVLCVILLVLRIFVSG